MEGGCERTLIAAELRECCFVVFALPPSAPSVQKPSSSSCFVVVRENNLAFDHVLQLSSGEVARGVILRICTLQRLLPGVRGLQEGWTWIYAFEFTICSRHGETRLVGLELLAFVTDMFLQAA